MEIELNGNKLNLTDEQVKEIVDKYSKTNKKWKPEEDEEYYYVDSYGIIMATYCSYSGTIDNWRYEQGNCFKTIKEAEKCLEYLNAVATLRNSSDFVPDMNDSNQWIYEVYYNRTKHRLGVDSSTICKYYDIVYYKTEKEARDSIKKYRKEWNIVFGIES